MHTVRPHPTTHMHCIVGLLSLYKHTMHAWEMIIAFDWWPNHYHIRGPESITQAT